MGSGDDPVAQPSGLRFHDPIDLPFGDRSRGAIPNDHINLIRWLGDVVEGLGGTAFMSRCDVVRPPHFKQPGGSMISIAAMGGASSIWTTYERLAVEACQWQVEAHGYFILDLSYFRIQQLESEESTVIQTAERRGFVCLIVKIGMSGHLQHRPRPSSSAQGAPSATSSARVAESTTLSAIKKNKRRRTGIGDRLPEQARPYLTPVGEEWEVYPYNTSRKPAAVMGALARIIYPDFIGPEGNKRVALSWEDYKWSPDINTPSAATLAIKEFWERFRCADGVDREAADSLLERNMSNRVLQMLSAMKCAAISTVRSMENATFNVDKDGNHWPTVDSMVLAKPDDFATKLSWEALCIQWSTASCRKKPLDAMTSRKAGGNIVHHCGGSRGLLATRQYLYMRDGVDHGELGAWQHNHRMQQGSNSHLCSEKAASNFAKYDEAMCEKYGLDWQNTQPNFITSVVAESTGGKPHGRYAIADSLVTKSSFYPSVQVVCQQVQSYSAWCAGVHRLLQELADKNELDFSTFMHPMLPSIDIDALMHSQHQGEVLAKKHSLDYNGLMNPRPLDQQLFL
ncbi:hypothetical protein C2845_PM09G20360 [Panicum miliaceum]|uniref:Uncharacterized protein n=1 Tax=Panicum miliaceum TaxID=4540 RepID=A0A3L6RZD4_PANMI|nr:hypothetical protein C2845_PM09G20360 [Panicum miliaceum]